MEGFSAKLPRQMDNEHPMVVVGFGINHGNEFSVADMAQLETAMRPPISLKEVLNDVGDGEQLIRDIRRYLLEAVALLEHGSWSALYQQLCQRDWLKGKHVCMLHNGTSLFGTAHEIAHDGQLVIADESGVPHTFSAGDLRLVNEHKETL